MTSTSHGTLTQRSHRAIERLLALLPRVASHLLVAAAIGLAAAAAGSQLRDAAAIAVLCGMLTSLLPRPRGRRRNPRTLPTAVTVAAEQRRGDAVRIMALELAVDRLRSVLESLREGVVVVDEGGEIVLANPEARLALRDPTTLPIGENLVDALAPELALAAREAMTALGDETLGRDRPVRLSAIAFGKRVIDLTAVRVRSRESGQDFGAVFLFVDATRSHELAHLKDRFLSGISHELRTPLTNICAYAEILRHLTPGETSEWPEFVRIVHEESLQLNRLVDTVFDYAQLESGEAKFEVVDSDPGPLVHASFDRVRERAATRGVTLHCECPDTLPKVAIDPARIAHVLDHLLDNALKFTPRDGHVRVRAVAEPGGLRITVEDSGPGVPPEERALIFEKFHQLGDHLTEKTAGAGIGLATTKAIVTRLGGSIRCDVSDLGGAAFVLAFPIAESSGRDRAAARSQVVGGGGGRSAGG